MKKLFTIGYEGAALEYFMRALKTAKIDVLLDVREIPISRRKGFSKTALSGALTEAGIFYRHEKHLGSPKLIRHRLREDGNYPRFFREFDRHLIEQSALLEMLSVELKGNVALMCYEKNHEECHRRSVADALAELLGKTPIHLGVDNHAGKASERARSYSRQGVSAGPHEAPCFLPGSSKGFTMCSLRFSSEPPQQSLHKYADHYFRGKLWRPWP